MAQTHSPPASRLSGRGVRAALAVLAGTALVAGCHKPDEIRKYSITRVEDRVRPFVIPEYELPAGWKELPKERAKVGRFLQSIQVGEGDARAKLTLTAFAGGIGDLLDNINRWRKIELQLDDPLVQLPRDLRKITVAKTECDYVDLQGPRNRTLAVIVPHEGHTWVVKMTGPDAAVAPQKAAFEKFVEGLSFPDE
jgi:hypothetical protein